MSNRSYLLSLAEKIYLTPSDSVLDECAIFIEQSRSDLELLKSIPSVQDIHYCYGQCGLSQHEFENAEAKVKRHVENKELLDSLLRDNAIIDTKKIS